MITADQARALFDYDPSTGQFVRRIARPGFRAGEAAGSLDHYGYLVIQFAGRKYKAHRLAWLYVHSAWPAGELDHIDGNKLNNRLSNLRPATSSTNAENKRRARRDNRLGLLGVSPKSGRFIAQLQVRGVKTHIGTFDTPEEAHAAYLAAKRAQHVGCSI